MSSGPTQCVPVRGTEGDGSEKSEEGRLCLHLLSCGFQVHPFLPKVKGQLPSTHEAPDSCFILTKKPEGKFPKIQTVFVFAVLFYFVLF